MRRICNWPEFVERYRALFVRGKAALAILIFFMRDLFMEARRLYTRARQRT